MMRHFSDFEELCMDLSECFASAKSDDIFDLISVALEKTASVMPMDEIILMMLSHDNAHVNILTLTLNSENRYLSMISLLAALG